MRDGREVAILGAGFGGLMAGAWLASRGYRVTVFEKATTVGGSAGWYLRRGRMVPTGATIAFGLEPGGLLRTLLDDVGVAVEAQMLDYPMDVVLSDRVVRILRDRTAWEHELRSVFVERGDAVVRFWRALAQLSDAVFAASAAHLALPPRRMRDFVALAGFALRQPSATWRLMRSAPLTVERLVRAHGLSGYTPLRELLNAQLVDAAQTDTRHAALVPASLALDIYRRGSFAFAEAGGLGAIARALAARITAAGGTVALATTVEQTHYDRAQRRWVITTNRSQQPQQFDAIIDNTGRDFQSASVIQAAPALQPESHPTSATTPQSEGWGAFRLDAILHKNALAQLSTPLTVADLPFAFQIVPERSTAQLFGDEHGPVYATLHPALDAQMRPIADEILLTVSVHTDAHSWASLPRDAYKQRKHELQQAILSELRKVLPTLDEQLIHIDAGTPKTYRKYVGKLEVGGAPLTIKNALLQPKSVYSKRPNYYYAGENVFPGPGTLSAALSGFFAARALDRKGRRR